MSYSCCRDCCSREPNCHSHCNQYKHFQEIRERVRQDISREELINRGSKWSPRTHEIFMKAVRNVNK
jgi:hypothetical protein